MQKSDPQSPIRAVLGIFTVTVLGALVLGEILSGRMQNQPLVLAAATQITPRNAEKSFTEAQPFPLAVTLTNARPDETDLAQPSPEPSSQQALQYRGRATATVLAAVPANKFDVSYACTENPATTASPQHARWNIDSRELGLLIENVGRGRAAVCNLTVRN